MGPNLLTPLSHALFHFAFAGNNSSVAAWPGEMWLWSGSPSSFDFELPILVWRPAILFLMCFLSTCHIACQTRIVALFLRMSCLYFESRYSEEATENRSLGREQSWPFAVCDTASIPYAFLIGGIGPPLKNLSPSRDIIATVCADIFVQTGQKVEPILIFGDIQKRCFVGHMIERI
jgi:hypothetical protein